jgi:hypothetical protein
MSSLNSHSFSPGTKGLWQVNSLGACGCFLCDACSGAHGWVRALQHVLDADPADVGGPVAGRQLRGGAAGGVPRRRGPQHRAGDRPHHAARLRQPVLRQPGAGAGALHLRPGALLRRPVPPHRGGLVAEQLRLRAGIRLRDHQPRARRRQDRPVAGEHSPGLRIPQLKTLNSASVQQWQVISIVHSRCLVTWRPVDYEVKSTERDNRE